MTNLQLNQWDVVTIQVPGTASKYGEKVLILKLYNFNSYRWVGLKTDGTLVEIGNTAYKKSGDPADRSNWLESLSAYLKEESKF